MKEDTLINYLHKQFSNHVNDVIGIGDDCAVIAINPQESLLITKDLLLDDVHFRTSTFSAADIAIKAVESNISDIAAMGGTPTFILLGIAIPDNLSDAWLTQFLAQFSKNCIDRKIQLIGGDTVRSDNKLCLSITLFGKAKPQYIKYRHTAKPGDIICTTGYLGDAKAGLYLLEHQKQNFPELIAKQKRPQACTAEGKWLAQQSAVHAMMDISDGLYLDLQKLIKASNCGANINVEHLPISSNLENFAQQYHFSAWQYALEGGEEYNLLFTVSAEQLEALQRQYQLTFGNNFFVIGKITYESNLTLLQNGKKVDPANLKPYQHFEEATNHE